MIQLLNVISKFLDFLAKPSGLGAFVFTLCVGCLLVAMPMGLIAWLSWDNTNRLERANKEGTLQVVGAINDLRTTLRNPVAYRNKDRLERSD